MPPIDYLSGVIVPLLQHPSTFKASIANDDMGILITMKVHKEDMGVVIGKKGDTANAVRHLLRLLGIHQHARISLRIDEPDPITEI